MTYDICNIYPSQIKLLTGKGYNVSLVDFLSLTIVIYFVYSAVSRIFAYLQNEEKTKYEAIRIPPQTRKPLSPWQSDCHGACGRGSMPRREIRT